ncbi:histidine phosphatase family protein [Sphingomonas colocasiae]|uniref:Histidine phosphatase family protein n=1 Tax=Sphingomonas colocasiae TaxID=1848973 RepID=A0ABS7PP79_9SPHN|nr:histidine phosphatase family protein [Sphingomonas colocasiae]MBY8823056.1 histidine phosphatase family protein [Sphingomonas colocasiae]
MFVIVRHGNTFAAGEPSRRIGARTDLPLTRAGREQAQALGVHFASLGWHFSRVLVSPLVRTVETARAILRHQPEPVIPEACEWLREIDHGPDEDMPEDAVLARIGREALSAWDLEGRPPPGWIVDGEARRAAWRDLFSAETSSGPILLVTSNGAARFALLAAPELALPDGMKLPTGAYGVIRRGAGDALTVPAWGMRP